MLSGADKMLNEVRPVFQVEISRSHNPSYMKVFECFEKNKYVGFALLKDGLAHNPLEYIMQQPTVIAEHERASPPGCWDYLFIPQQIVESLTHELFTHSPGSKVNLSGH